MMVKRPFLRGTNAEGGGGGQGASGHKFKNNNFVFHES